MDLADTICVLVAAPDGSVRLRWPPGAAAGEARREGETWRTALGAFVDLVGVPDVLPCRPWQCTAADAEGRPVAVQFFPMTGAQGDGVAIQVVRRGIVFSRHAQRLHALGMVAAGAAHEMNNLLTVASGWLGLLLADGSVGGPQCECLRKTADSVEQLGRLSMNLLDFARAPAGERVPVDLNEVVRRVAGLVDYQLEKNNIAIRLDLAEGPLSLEGSPGDLAQALLNLVLNARAAMPRGGKLTLATRREADSVLLDVSDTGCGIPDHVRRRLFEPFFTTHGASGGTGLGLSICKEIVQRHGGEISVNSRPGEGACFTIRLPAAGAARAAQTAPVEGSNAVVES